ncbi:MAG: hypothetical protein WBA22_01250 [Candidatus Methanofastidiosia archaeon]
MRRPSIHLDTSIISALFDDIIRNLTKRAKYVEFMEESYRILDTEKNWINLDDV